MVHARWAGWDTRWRIIELLRRGPHTVRAAADELGLTASAVRLHVTALERDGVVRRGGRAQGMNRPAAIFELAPGVDTLLCSAYVPFVANLLQVLGEEIPEHRVAALMHRAGRRLAASYGAPSGTLRQRAQAASEFLNKLGAVTHIEAAAGRLTIRGFDCPLAAAVHGRAEVCRAMESFVAELVRTDVHECCDRSGRPRCCFEILSASPRPAPGAGPSPR